MAPVRGLAKSKHGTRFPALEGQRPVLGVMAAEIIVQRGRTLGRHKNRSKAVHVKVLQLKICSHAASRDEAVHGTAVQGCSDGPAWWRLRRPGVQRCWRPPDPRR